MLHREENGIRWSAAGEFAADGDVSLLAGVDVEHAPPLRRGQLPSENDHDDRGEQDDLASPADPRCRAPYGARREDQQHGKSWQKESKKPPVVERLIKE